MILANTTNFVLAGGGEPGLLLAGLAIADELRASVPHARVVFAGSGTGPEVRRICRTGYEYVALGGACEDRPVRAWQWPWTRWGEPRLLLKRIRPAAVVSLGGAIGESVGRAAAGLRLPLVILEQHVSASLTTRRLAAKAQLICLGFEETRRNLAANCPIRVTGIPLTRPDPPGGDAAPTDDAAVVRAGAGRLVILGDGGSSRTMNAVLPRAIGRLQGHIPHWRVVHRTHGDDVRPVKRLYRRFGIDAVTTGHIHNLPGLLARSDLVIATTPPSDVVELSVSATPIVAAIEADSPECSQVRTARTLAQRGACLLVEQPHHEQAWTQVLKPLLSDSGHRRRLAAAMQRHFRNDAAWHMAGMIRDLISSAAGRCVA